jgi:hypothetical protein
MDAFHKVHASMQREGDIHVCIKKMHTHTRETELKEEEELSKCEEALKKRE